MTESTSQSSPPKQKGGPYRVKFEPRIDEPSRWTQYLVSFIALIVALILGAALIAIAGGDPVKSYILSYRILW
jgi:hypothetical protein